MRQSTAISCLFIGFFVITTTHFGLNWFTQSDAGIVCDGALFIIGALGYVAKAIENRTTTPST